MRQNSPLCLSPETRNSWEQLNQLCWLNVSSARWGNQFGPVLLIMPGLTFICNFSLMKGVDPIVLLDSWKQLEENLLKTRSAHLRNTRAWKLMNEIKPSALSSWDFNMRSCVVNCIHLFSLGYSGEQSLELLFDLKSAAPKFPSGWGWGWGV